MTTTQNGYKLKKERKKQGFCPFNSNEISHGKVVMHTAPIERKGTQKEEKGRQSWRNLRTQHTTDET